MLIAIFAVTKPNAIHTSISTVIVVISFLELFPLIFQCKDNAFNVICCLLTVCWNNQSMTTQVIRVYLYCCTYNVFFSS